MSVPPLQLLNLVTDFEETWHELCALELHPSVILSNFLQLVMRVRIWPPLELLRWKRHVMQYAEIMYDNITS
jgi:hypothetical protein